MERLTLGELLKQLREEQGLTMQDLATEINMTTAEICNIENDKSKPTGPTVYKLSQALRFDYDTLFDMVKKCKVN